MTTNDLAESLKDTVIFIDRSAGKAVARAFVDVGAKIELHDDLYAQTTIDVEWLVDCGTQKKIVLSANHKIKNNKVERDALLNSKVGAFFFTTGDWNTEEKLSALRKAMLRIAKIILNEKRPFIARIHKNGTVEKWVNHKGKELKIRGKR